MNEPSFSKTAAEIAELVSGTLEGDGSLILTGVAGLGDAGPQDISFLGNPKYAAEAKLSTAGCLILPPQGKKIESNAKCRIIAEDPQYAFSQILTVIQSSRPHPEPVISEKAEVHYQARLGSKVSVGPFSVIGRAALVGEGTEIGPLCSIGENVKIGRYCVIHPRVVIREDCVIGDRVVLQPGAVIGGDGYGFSTDKKTGKHRKIPQIGNVIIENDVEVGANTTIDRATVGSTLIGEGTKIDDLVMLAHNVKTGKDCLIVSQTGVSGSTTLGDRVILAGQAGLVGHLKIGDDVIVGAQSGVMNDIEKGQRVWGNPVRPIIEELKLQALLGKLPGIYETIKRIKKEQKAEAGT